MKTSAGKATSQQECIQGWVNYVNLRNTLLLNVFYMNVGILGTE